MFNHKVISWIESTCRHPSVSEGLYNQPFKLLKWQKEIIEECFSPEGELKKCGLVLFGPRKYGKSIFLLTLLCYFLYRGRRGGRIPVCGPTYKSGIELFEIFSEMVKLIRNSTHNGSVTIRKDKIFSEINGTKIYVASSSPKGSTISIPSAVLFEEVCKHENRKNIRIFETAMGAQKTPFSIYLSNPSEKPPGSHFFFDFLNWARKEKKKKKSDWCIKIHEAPYFEKDNKTPIPFKKLLKEKYYHMANPSLKEGADFTNMKFIKRMSEEALLSQPAEADFRRLFLGQHVSSEGLEWIDGQDFQVIPTLKKYKTLSIGLDLSLSRDRTAVVYCSEIAGGYFFKAVYYLPEIALSKLKGQHREQTERFIKQGWIKLQKKARILSQDAVLDDIKEEIKKASNPLKSVLDPACGASYIAEKLQTSISVELTPNSPRNITPLINFLTPINDDKQFFYDGNPVLQTDFYNTLLTSTQSKNYRSITRRTNNYSIDGAMATLLALKPFYDRTKRNTECFFI